MNWLDYELIINYKLMKYVCHFSLSQELNEKSTDSFFRFCHNVVAKLTLSYLMVNVFIADLSKKSRVLYLRPLN